MFAVPFGGGVPLDSVGGLASAPAAAFNGGKPWPFEGAGLVAGGVEVRLAPGWNDCVFHAGRLLHRFEYWDIIIDIKYLFAGLLSGTPLRGPLF